MNYIDDESDNESKLSEVIKDRIDFEFNIFVKEKLNLKNISRLENINKLCLISPELSDNIINDNIKNETILIEKFTKDLYDEIIRTSEISNDSEPEMINKYINSKKYDLIQSFKGRIRNYCIERFRITIDKEFEKIKNKIITENLDNYYKLYFDKNSKKLNKRSKIEEDIYRKIFKNNLLFRDFEYLEKLIRDLINQIESLCIDKLYKYSVNIDRNSLFINNEIKQDLIEFIESFYEYSFLENEKIKAVKYNTGVTTTNILLPKILKKYKNECYISSTRNMYMTDSYSKQYKEEIISYNIDLGYFEPGVDIIKPRQYFKDDISENELNFINKQFKYCIENNVKVIAIPIHIPGHANALIYKVDKNLFEYFEPHGVNEEILDKIKINKFIYKIIYYLVKNNTIPKNPKYKDAEQTCPVLNDNQKRGFQYYETYDILDFFGVKNFDLGYCQMWSLLYLELSLRYPNIDTTILNQTVFDYIKNRDRNDRGFIIFITGYAYKNYKEAEEEGNNVETGVINREYINMESLKHLHKQNKMCFNPDSEEDNEIYDYLNKDIDNNIIIGVYYKGIYSKIPHKSGKIFCYKRDKILAEFFKNDNEYLTILPEYGAPIKIKRKDLDEFKDPELFFYLLKLNTYSRIFEVTGYEKIDFDMINNEGIVKEKNYTDENDD